MRTLVIMPTYNEIENLDSMVRRLRLANPEVDLLIADDNSPDGTGVRADFLAAQDSKIKVLHRPGKQGLGAAYRAGFAWGIEHGYEALVEMDADGSHQPEQLPQLLRALDSADVVLGSRWVRGGSVVNWPVSRKLLSRGGSFYARILLGVPIHDVTGGFRAFRVSAVQRMGLLASSAQGYVFQVDSSFRASQLGLRIVEVPIQFVERTAGVSKMSRNIVFEAMWQVTKWGVRHRLLRQPLS